MTPDPIGLYGGINLFLYADGNSINWIDPWGLKRGDWWDLRTYVAISFSHTWMGEGETISNGIEQKTKSPLTIAGASIDVMIGILPSPRYTVYEYGLGAGKHLGIGHFYGNPDAIGSYQVGGLAIHFGLGFGSPFFISETLPDPNRPFSNFSDLDLFYESNCP